MHPALLAAAMVTSSAAAAASPDVPSAAPGREGPLRAGDVLEGAAPADTGSVLRLVATLLLEGEDERARGLAVRLLEQGALSASEPDDARDRARRALELLSGIWPDPEAALAVLGERPDSGDVAWPVRLEVRVSLESFLTGEAGHEWEPEPIEHVTRAQVRDLHITRLVTLPVDLPPGEYELRIDVRDLAPGGAEGLGLRRFVVGKR